MKPEDPSYSKGVFPRRRTPDPKPAPKRPANVMWCGHDKKFSVDEGGVEFCAVCSVEEGVGHWSASEEVLLAARRI